MNDIRVTPAQAGVQSPAGLRAIVVPVAAMLLGATLIYLAGFAPIEALHDGAHDARHSAAFPCH